MSDISQPTVPCNSTPDQQEPIGDLAPESGGSEKTPSEEPALAQPTPGPSPSLLEPQKQQRKERAENQDYVRVLNTYSGDIPQVYIDHVTVGQDMYLGTRISARAQIIPPPERDSAEVPAREIDKIRKVYQRHAAYPLALKALRDTRCAVLLGRPQIGKRAAAISLAAEVRREGAGIWELSHEEDPTDQIRTAPLRPGTVYLVDGLLRDQGQSLKPLAAQAMLDTLARHDCYLIVCARLDVPFPRTLKTIEVVPLDLPTHMLVEIHLAYYGAFSVEQIESALSHPQVEGLLQGALSPSQADKLASLLAGALQDEDSIETALLGFAAAAEGDVQRWFDEVAGDIDAAAFRIALAVFNGASYNAVDEAARALSHSLQPKPLEEQDRPAPLPLVSPLTKPKRTEKLQSANARLVKIPMATEYSDSAMIEVVELQDPRYSRALLKYLWTEFDDLRPVLLDWLCQYSVQAPRDLRLRAAGAIGALAALDFDYIRAHVFHKWAYSRADNPDERRRNYQALGNALGVLIWTEERADDVLGLLRAWVDEGNSALRWAAARAYAQVGLQYPREAIRQWRKILESEASVTIRLTESFGIAIPHPLHMSVMDAIVSLFLRAVEIPHRLRPIYEQAIEGLSAWVEADAKDRTSQGYGLPLFLVLTTIRFPSEDRNDDPDDWPPAMLYIVGTQPDSIYRRTLAEMLYRALKEAHLRPLAVTALRNWAECAEKDPEWLEKTLIAFLRELLSIPDESGRIRGLLKVYLTRWSSHPKSQLEVATRLQVALNLN